MAFVLDRSWDATASWSRPAPTGIFAPLLVNGRDRAVRKAGATLLSVLVHILLLWLFVSRLAGNVGAGDGSGAGDGPPNIFSLSTSASAAASAPAEAVRPHPPAAPVASEIDASAASELPPSEWSVSRLPPAPEPAAQSRRESAAAGAAPGPSPGAGAGAGSGGADIYDPYAGATPLRRDAGAQPRGNWLGERVLGFFGFAPASAGGLTLDEKALEAVRLAVARSLPGRHGTAELVVRVSPTGVVLDVESPGGSAPRDARHALGQALIGKRLFLGAAVDAQTVTLPTLRFG